MLKRRSLHAQKMFGKVYSEQFVEHCRFNSLLARLSKSSKNFASSLFSDVPGIRMDLMPTLKPVIPLNGVRFTGEFNGKWGTIHSEIYESYRDAIRSRHQMEKVVDFEPPIDATRLLIGGEYQPAFTRPNLSRYAATKRPRSDSRTRLTPKNKSKFCRGILILLILNLKFSVILAGNFNKGFIFSF